MPQVTVRNHLVAGMVVNSPNGQPVAFDGDGVAVCDEAAGDLFRQVPGYLVFPIVDIDAERADNKPKRRGRRKAKQDEGVFDGDHQP